jgi:hypothetical protein
LSMVNGKFSHALVLKFVCTQVTLAVFAAELTGFIPCFRTLYIFGGGRARRPVYNLNFETPLQSEVNVHVVSKYPPQLTVRLPSG